MEQKKKKASDLEERDIVQVTQYKTATVHRVFYIGSLIHAHYTGWKRTSYVPGFYLTVLTSKE